MGFREALLCPLCSHKRDNRILISAGIAWLLLGVVAFTLALAFPEVSAGVWLLNAWILLFIYLISIIMHEFGHVFGGLLSGFRIYEFQIGTGEVVHDFAYAGIKWKFRVIPIAGRVLGWSPNVRGFRLRESIFIIAGPATNAIVAALGFALLPLDESAFTGPFAGFIPFHLIMNANCLMLFASLLPHTAKFESKRYPNDALQLWQLWQRKAPDLKAVSLQYQVLEITSRFDQHRFEEAAVVVSKAQENHPEIEFFEYAMAVVKIRQKDYVDSRTRFHKLLAKLKPESPLRMHAVSAIAFVDFMMQKPELLAEADEFSRQAAESADAINEFRGTRAMVLLDMGRDEDAVKILQHVYRMCDNKSDKAYHACCLGIAAGRKGKHAEKSVYFKLARALDSRCLLLERENTA